MNNPTSLNPIPLSTIKKEDNHFAFLSSDHIDIWYLEYDQFSLYDLQKKIEAWMSDEEKERFKKFVFEKDRKSFLATRYLIRSVLSFYYPTIHPISWKFYTNKYGKPFVANKLATPIYFNISNTINLAVCAISTLNEKIGIDTECITRASDMNSIIDISLSEEEKFNIFSLPPENHQKQILLYWTIKEAYIKAQGLGLSIEPNKVTIKVKQNNIYINHAQISSVDCINWNTHCYDFFSKNIVTVSSLHDPKIYYQAFSAWPLISRHWAEP